MSLVADFARSVHENEPVKRERPLVPLEFSSAVEKLHDIRAVIFDVYGTLVDYWRHEFSDKDAKERFLLKAFNKTATRFSLASFLKKMNPEHPPELTLRDLYHGLIALKHEQGKEKGIEYPEVQIENIWMIMIMMLKRYGFQPETLELGNDRELARCMAFYYNYHVLGRGLFPGVVECCKALRKQNVILGILSNAQFYTPIDLTLFIRDQSSGEFDDYNELFDLDFCFFSYSDGIAKPGKHMFEKLFAIFKAYQILPSQAIFAGNDLLLDIKTAQDLGMQTAFFTGDRECAFVRNLGSIVQPDLSISSWDDFPPRVSFYEEKGSQV
ncbi:MAG: hypothetical protein GF401_13590 [Chitinivibrionales bacterium]|nr:hypothetical protein [Chitinivibrionales bacterium]